MKNIFTLLLLLLFSTLIYPQSSWFECNNLNGVAHLNSGSIIAVGGGFSTNFPFGTIFRSTDEGNSWLMDTTFNATLYGISFSNLNNGTVVGDAGTILRTTNGGETWVGQISGTGYSLSAVSFSDSTTGTVVGYLGKIFRTTNAGNTWFSQTSGTSSWLHGVTFKDINNGWAVGDYGILLHTTDGGNNWVQQSSGTNQTLYAVSFSDLSNGVISGSNGTILRTTDGGVNWVYQSLGIGNNLYGISLVDNDWNAVGDWGIIIRNGIIQESKTTNRLIGVCSANVNKCTAVGWFGTVLNTTDSGNLWANKLWTQVSSYQFSYNGHNRNYFVFTPYNYSGLSSLPLMICLTGSGQTGQLMQDYSRMNTVADTSGFIAVYPSPYGSNWDLSADVGFISKLIDSVNVNYNVNLSKVYVCGMSMGGFMTHELGCKLSNRIAAIAPVAGTILNSTVSNCNSIASPPMIYIHGTLDTWVPYSGVEQTLDFWIERNNANVSLDSVALPDIDTTDGCTVLKYLYRNSEGVARVVFYKIINGGHSWPGMNFIAPALGLTNRDINASQEIWKFVKEFDIPVGISENLQVVPKNFILFQNYPNPFNNKTIIKYSIPMEGLVTLKVFNIIGEEVTTLVNEVKQAGSYQIAFNSAQLPSGVYFYQLRAGNFVETKKMLLLK